MTTTILIISTTLVTLVGLTIQAVMLARFFHLGQRVRSWLTQTAQDVASSVILILVLVLFLIWRAVK